MVSWEDAVTPSDSQGMAGALDPTGAICGSYDEGVGTMICVDPWPLQLGAEKKKIATIPHPAGLRLTRPDGSPEAGLYPLNARRQNLRGLTFTSGCCV